MEKDTLYFSHDSNARNDIKIIKLRASKDGLSKYGVYWMLIEKLRESKGYMLEKDFGSLSWEFRCDNSLIKSVIEDFGLFDFTENGKCLYSKRLLRSMEIKNEKQKHASLKGIIGNLIKNKHLTKEQIKEMSDNEIIELNNTIKRPPPDRYPTAERPQDKISKDKESKVNNNNSEIFEVDVEGVEENTTTSSIGVVEEAEDLSKGSQEVLDSFLNSKKPPESTDPKYTPRTGEEFKEFWSKYREYFKSRQDTAEILSMQFGFKKDENGKMTPLWKALKAFLIERNENPQYDSKTNKLIQWKNDTHFYNDFKSWLKYIDVSKYNPKKKEIYIP